MPWSQEPLEGKLVLAPSQVAGSSASLNNCLAIVGKQMTGGEFLANGLKLMGHLCSTYRYFVHFDCMPGKRKPSMMLSRENKVPAMA